MRQLIWCHQLSGRMLVEFPRFFLNTLCEPFFELELIATIKLELTSGEYFYLDNSSDIRSRGCWRQSVVIGMEWNGTDKRNRQLYQIQLYNYYVLFLANTLNIMY